MNCRIEISREAISHNYRVLNNLNLDVPLCPIIKSNAYGHGILAMYNILSKIKNPPSHFGVFSWQEAIKIKELGFKGHILVLGYTPIRDLVQVSKNEFIITVSSVDYLKKISDTKIEITVHLKIECGTNRQGIKVEQFNKVFDCLKNNGQIKVEGAYTHFANIEDTVDHEFAMKQLDRFNKAVKEIKKEISIKICHTACSAAYLLFPETHLDLIRLGISLYGYWPSKETRISFKERIKNQLELRPAILWKTYIGQIKLVEPGESIGYGCDYQVNMPMKIAVLPVGYSDGYLRNMAGKAFVLIKGKRAQVIGRICMNIIMVSITHIPDVELEEEVVLLGKQGSNEISADNLAEWSGTINYEILTRLPANVKREVVE